MGVESTGRVSSPGSTDRALGGCGGSATGPQTHNAPDHDVLLPSCALTLVDSRRFCTPPESKRAKWPFEEAPYVPLY